MVELLSYWGRFSPIAAVTFCSRHPCGNQLNISKTVGICAPIAVLANLCNRTTRIVSVELHDLLPQCFVAE